MAKPYIAAYQAGSTDVSSFIDKDQIIYWYRVTPKNADCNDTANTISESPIKQSEIFFRDKPDGYNSMADSVFAVSLLKNPGKLTIASGSSSRTFDAPAGANAYEVPMVLGKQSFELQIDGKTTLFGTSSKEITNKRHGGVWNFNAYVGTIPAGEPDHLLPDGKTLMMSGLPDTARVDWPP